MSGAASLAMHTILMTDVVGSTRQWEQEPAEMSARMERHDRLAEATFADFYGTVIKERGEGDSLFVRFGSPSHAIAGAIAFRDRASSLGIRLRCAIHMGETVERDGDLYGPAVNRCARMRAAANPDQILVSHAVYLACRDGSEFDLQDLGQHRLKDLNYPEHIYTLAQDPFGPFPPLKTLDSYLHNLPVQSTPFIGRASDVVRIAESTTRHRLVSLTGAGGIGKTRLSLQVAAEVAPEFDGGVYFVDLAPVESPEDVEKTIAVACGHSADEDLYRALAASRCFIVLDNCEQVVDEVARIAARIIANCRAHILATSRISLGIASEHELRVPPLTLPPAYVDGLADARRSEAVEMLVERLSARAPQYPIDDDTAPGLARVARKLDGLPLAIELVVPRFRTMSAAQVEAHLDRQSRLLQDPKAAVDRHRTIGTSIQWSYELLDPEVQTFFRALSVFPGSWDVPLAHSVSNYEDELDTVAALEQLYDASLIVREEGATETDRSRFLQPVRQFAFELLEATGAIDEYRRRAFFGIAEWATKWRQEVITHDRNDLWKDADAKSPSLEGLFDWAVSDLDLAPTAARLAYNWHLYYLRRQEIQSGLATIGTAKQLVEGQDQELFALLVNVEGALEWNRGNFDRAEACFLRALTEWQALSNPARMLATQHNLGLIAVAKGELELAFRRFESALGIESAPELARFRWNVGIAYASIARDLGRLPEAREAYSQLLAYDDSSPWQKAQVLANRSRLEVAQGDLAAAHTDLIAALPLARDGDDESALQDLLFAGASYALAVGSHDAAASALKRMRANRKQHHVHTYRHELTQIEDMERRCEGFETFKLESNARVLNRLAELPTPTGSPCRTQV